jgi:iron complex outermembrane receptor protein
VASFDYLVGVLVGAILMAAPAIAAQTAPEDLTDLSLEQLKTVQVYSASMYLQNDREAPSSVTVITSDQIRRFGYRTLADVLRSVRGFYISYDRNYSYVGVRGLGPPGDYNTRILLLLNGHRLTDDLYNSALIGTEFQLDVSLIDRVEIVRGPSSSLYGNSAFFAVVNVITRDAQSVRGIELSGEADGFGTYKGRSTYGQQFHHGIELLLSGTVSESAGPARLFFPAFNSPAQNHGYAIHADDDSSKSFFGNLKVAHFTLEAVGSTREKGIPTGAFNTVFNDDRTRTVDDRGYLDVRYDRTFRRDSQFTARVYFDRVNYHGVYVYPPAQPQGPDVLNEDLGRGDWFGISGNLTTSLKRRHKLTFGADFRDDLRQEQENYNQNPLLLYLQDRHDSKEWAVYAQDEFSLRKGLILNAGLRHDQYETFGGTTNPRIALIYSPLSRTTFKAIYGRAFRAPNNYELYYHDGVTLEANPHLKPERIRTAELVWEQELGSRLRFTVDGFDNHITGLITQQTDPATGLLFYANREGARSRGLELELAGTAGRLEGRVSYSLQRTVDGRTHISLTNSPRQSAKMNVICPMAHRSVFLAWEAQYTDSRRTLATSPAGAFAIANVTVSSREFGGGFRVSGSVYNVFGRRYGDPVGAEIPEPALQQNGRDFRIKLTRVIHLE